jgi:ribosomal protein S18 acetylase RimI-like enzyme
MNVRPVTIDDADVVAAMVVADSEALTGRPSRLGPSDVREWWSRTQLDRDSWLVEEAGKPVAVGWMHAYGDKAAFAGIVAQGAKGRGLGGELAGRAEAAAQAQGLARMHTWVLPEDAAAVELFRLRGYGEARRFYEMAIELDAPPPEPEVAVEPFREEDAHAFHDAIEEAFQDHWEWHGTPFPKWWELRRGDDHGLWFVVRDGDELAAAVRNDANRNGGGYVGIIGVRRAWRGRGFAKALLYRTFGEFWQRGINRVSLDVDADSPTGATRLYESVGMHVESTMAVYER